MQIAVLDEKANEAMMLKFGRIVDLDRLEGLSVNHIVEDLRSNCLLYTSPSPRDATLSRMPSSA